MKGKCNPKESKGARPPSPSPSPSVANPKGAKGARIAKTERAVMAGAVKAMLPEGRAPQNRSPPAPSACVPAGRMPSTVIEGESADRAVPPEAAASTVAPSPLAASTLAPAQASIEAVGSTVKFSSETERATLKQSEGSHSPPSLPLPLRSLSKLALSFTPDLTLTLVLSLIFTQERAVFEEWLGAFDMQVEDDAPSPKP